MVDIDDRYRRRVFNKQRKRWEDDLWFSDDGGAFGRDMDGDMSLCCTDYYQIENCMGVEDRLGKLIYEGDRLRSYQGNPQMDNKYPEWTVVWSPEWCSYMLLADDMVLSHFPLAKIVSSFYEIVGNIHGVDYE